ncbi:MULTISPECIES: alpha-1,2-fucosyltransferase [Enterobacterales]|uniref:alpha-1,2-fucosyltransferase n=1 Tax=Enterobacterales TaxID=91347 RepID=UPI001EF8E444|nr:alpha-1,2-fucosyltransferase [Citrobacter portucalensis]ULK51943.1 alpha-1,2-fucosyltransferase [Citrobacter portucalensis]
MKRKTVIFLSGGLGNNLFQIAYGEYLNQNGYHVCYNTYLTQKNIVTKFLGWSIHKNEITSKLLMSKTRSDKLNVIDIIFLAYTLFKKKIKHDNLHSTPEVPTERYFGYATQGNHLNKKIFSILANKINMIFHEKISKEKKGTVLHIRRGDFSKDCSLADEYYINSLEKMKIKDEVIIVTDTPKIMGHVKKYISENARLSNGKSMLDDFFVILNAEKVIMSNSTYCYWACILGNVKQVTFPNRISKNKNWFLSLNEIPSQKITCRFLSEME